MTKFKLHRKLDVRMYEISAPLCAFLGAGDETRTRDSLLGRRSALCAVALRGISASSCDFLLLLTERKLSSYGVAEDTLTGELALLATESCGRALRVDLRVS
jgi:hypothetical protein